jgi:hypothetical protein
VGEVSTKSKVVGDQVFWMLNAPTFFGNSGGGIYLGSTCQLIGISSMIYTYGKASPAVVPHMGLFVPLETLYDWLDTKGYSFIWRREPAGGLIEKYGLNRAAGGEGERLIRSHDRILIQVRRPQAPSLSRFCLDPALSVIRSPPRDLREPASGGSVQFAPVGVLPWASSQTKPGEARDLRRVRKDIHDVSL